MPASAVAIVLAVPRGVAAGVGPKKGVSTELGVSVGAAGSNVEGGCAPDTGRASSRCASCVPVCHWMGAADPARFHSAAAPSTSGMARAVASKSRSRTPSYSSRMFERSTGDWAGRHARIMVVGLITIAPPPRTGLPALARPTCTNRDIVAGCPLSYVLDAGDSPDHPRSEDRDSLVGILPLAGAANLEPTPVVGCTSMSSRLQELTCDGMMSLRDPSHRRQPVPSSA